jgi:hypothetical protein
METERDVESLLSRVADDAGLSILPRIRGAIALIERCQSFEGDGDLAAAHLVLREVARDIAELYERADQALAVYGVERQAGVLALIDRE